MQRSAQLDSEAEGSTGYQFVSTLRDEQLWETEHQNAAQRVYESRVPKSYRGDINIRLAQYRLFKELNYTIHPVDVSVRDRWANRILVLS